VLEEPQRRNQALKDLLERAERTGDDQQADAVYHLARERGMWDVADSYAATRPKAKETWEKYTAARQEAESVHNRLFGWNPPRKPQELDGAPLPGEGFAEAGGGAGPSLYGWECDNHKARGGPGEVLLLLPLL
jgi:hypothetical protein